MCCVKDAAQGARCYAAAEDCACTKSGVAPCTGAYNQCCDKGKGMRCYATCP